MRVLVVSLAAAFMLTGVPALSSAATADGVRSADLTSCRARKKKSKKQTADNKGKKKGKGDKKAYGFEL